MLVDFYNWAHSIGIHFYELPALALVVIAAVNLLVHSRKQKKRDEAFRNQLNSETKTEEAAAAASPEK